MVEIREEPSEPSPGSDASTSAGASQGDQPPASMSISQFVSTNLMECCMNATRLMTLFFAICYVLPMLSPISPDSAYFKAFAAAAATNALRMQQRVGTITLSREFFARLMLEDSCHYILYSVLFLTSTPVTMALLPIFIFSGLQVAAFATKLMQTTGSGNSAVCLKLSQLVREHTPTALGIVACAEIFLIPILISMIFVGKASVFMPFLYYRFLTLRYASRRNPYTRQAFASMRFSLEQVAASPRCPAPVRMLVSRSVNFISGLAPAF